MNPAILQEDIKRFTDRFPLFDKLRGKSFLITGATGLIGSILAKCLLELNRRKHLNLSVTACVRDARKAESLFQDYPDIRLLTLSLEDLSSTTLSGVDFLVHLASPTASGFFVSHPVETMHTIINGTDAVLGFARRNQVGQVLYVSSMEVYGTLPNSVVATEDRMGDIDPTKARSSYPLAKRAAEALCLNHWTEYGMDVRIARLSQTFGAGISETENRVFAQFAKSAINKQDIVLRTTGESAHCYCYTTDAVAAMLYILFNGKAGRVYNVGNKSTFCTIKEMAQLVCRSFNPASCVRVEIDPSAPYPSSSRLILDMTRLENLGWSPEYSLEEMYSRLIQFLS
jgi:nucleoside-diphosphate-sugar epimerase